MLYLDWTSDEDNLSMTSRGVAERRNSICSKKLKMADTRPPGLSVDPGSHRTCGCLALVSEIRVQAPGYTSILEAGRPLELASRTSLEAWTEKPHFV